MANDQQPARLEAALKIRNRLCKFLETDEMVASTVLAGYLRSKPATDSVINSCIVWNFCRLVLFPERRDCAGDDRLGLTCEFTVCCGFR